MSDLKTLFETRAKSINEILAAVVMGDGFDILEAAHANAETILDIDEALSKAKAQGEAIRDHLTTMEGPSSSSTVSRYLLDVKDAMEARGYSTVISSRDRSRVDGILNAKAPQTPSGKASAMVKNTTNLEKLYARGACLYDLGHGDLAYGFFHSIAESLLLTCPPRDLWDGGKDLEEIDVSTPFDLSDEDKVKAFNSLLVVARTMVDRKVSGMTTRTQLEAEALMHLVGLLGTEALQTLE
jgi:hypothetical protein